MVVHFSFIEIAIALFAAIAVALLLRWVLRRALGEGDRDSVAGTVMEPLAGVYGLLLAFLIGGVADRAVKLRDTLRIETDSYHRMEQIASALPVPIGGELQLALEMYARTEVAARTDRPAIYTDDVVLNDIWLAVALFEPQRPQDSLLQAEALAELRTLREVRIIAGRAMRYAHGIVIWLPLMAGYVSIIVVCAVAGVGDPRGPFYLAALTTVMTIMLYVLYALSRPLTVAPFQLLADVSLR